MANPSTIVETTTPVRPWDPTSLTAYLGLSYVDLRFSGGGGDVTPMRLLANGDVRLYGELLMETGLVRSYEGFGFTSYGTTEPLVSFRYGAGVGTEMLRINNDGSVQSRSGASLVLKGEVPSGGTTGIELSLSNDAPSGKSVLLVKESAGTVLSVSGNTPAVGNVTVLRGYGPSGFQIQALDAGNFNRNLKIVGLDVEVTAHGDNVFFKEGSGTTRVQFDLNSANMILTAGDNHSADLVLDSTADSGKRWNIRSGNVSGKLLFINATDSVQVEIDAVGNIFTPGYMKMQVVSSLPSSPTEGTFVAYRSGSTIRWYVYFGSDGWKRVDLVT